MIHWTLIYLLATVAVLFGTFVFLCATLKLRDAKEADKLKAAPWILLAFAYTTLLIGLLLDVALNILLSIPLLEPPQEWLTTDRVKRLKHGGNDWQRACSRWLCAQLHSIDDNHCGGT